MTADEMGRCLSRLKLVITQWAPKEIDKDMALIWLAILKDYSDTEIKDAFSKAAANLTEWPAPAAIKRLCQGTIKSDEEIGQEVASRIEGAIRRFGYSGPNEAQKFIGPLGWEVVRQSGGWVSICGVEDEQLLSSRKLWRDSASIISKNFHFNGQNLPPEIPGKKNPALAAALKLVTDGL